MRRGVTLRQFPRPSLPARSCAGGLSVPPKAEPPSSRSVTIKPKIPALRPASGRPRGCKCGLGARAAQSMQFGLAALAGRDYAALHV